MREVLAPTTDEHSPQALRLLDLMNRLTEERAAENKLAWDKVWWTRRQLREQSGWSQRQLRGALQQLAELEYVAQRGGGLGCTEFYQVIDDQRSSFPGSSLAGPPPMRFTISSWRQKPRSPPARCTSIGASARRIADQPIRCNADRPQPGGWPFWHR